MNQIIAPRCQDRMNDGEKGRGKKGKGPTTRSEVCQIVVLVPALVAMGALLHCCVLFVPLCLCRLCSGFVGIWNVGILKCDIDDQVC
jgi:hypothetical protein